VKKSEKYYHFPCHLISTTSYSKLSLLQAVNLPLEFCFLRPVSNITMTLHSYWPVILVAGCSIRKRYVMVVNYLQSVPGTRVTVCCITIFRSTGVVLKSHIDVRVRICRTCSSSAIVCLRNGSEVARLKKRNSVAQGPF
jgi:hypothetical protein